MHEDWNRDEIEAVVNAYFWMLGQQVAGLSYAKKDVVRSLRFGELAARSESSVARKLSNISAVMNSEGAPWLPGFKPLEHFQKALKEHVMLVARQRGVLPPVLGQASHRRNRKL